MTDRSFGIFWSVQTLSVAGDAFSLVALPLLVYAATGSVAQMGLLTGLGGVARIVAGLFAGSLADRVDRRTLLLACDAFRAVLFGLVPVVQSVWILYAVVPLGAAAGMLFSVAYVASVPNLVEPDRITEANGRLNATYAAASIVGPALAGLVSHAFGPATAIAIDAGTFAVSFLGLLVVRFRPHDGLARSVGEGAAARSGPLRDFLAGARFLWQQPTLRALTCLLTVQLFLTAGVDDVLIYYLKHDVGADDRTVGSVIAIGGAGSIVAALLVARARRRLGFGVCWIGSSVLGGVALGLVGLDKRLSVVAALVTVFSFALGIGGTCSMSLRQEVTPNRLLGRVTAAFWTVHYVLAPIGAAVVTTLAGRAGVPIVCLAAGLGCVLIGAAALATPVRLARPETAG